MISAFDQTFTIRLLYCAGRAFDHFMVMDVNHS